MRDYVFIYITLSLYKHIQYINLNYMIFYKTENEFLYYLTTQLCEVSETYNSYVR